MKKNISLIISMAVLALGLGTTTSSGGENEETTIYSNHGPPAKSCDCCPRTTWDCTSPYSGGNCETAVCGRIIGLNSFDWYSRSTGILLGVHTTGPISFDVWWARRAGNPWVNSEHYSFGPGDYQLYAEDLGDNFLSVGNDLGGVVIDWRACGPAFVYSDFFYDFAHTGQRTNRATSYLCPPDRVELSDVPCCESQALDYRIDGCYEIPVVAGANIRASFFNESEVEWQEVAIQGVGSYFIPPHTPGDPQVTMVSFKAPANKMLDICVGVDGPYSGGPSFSDECIYAAFEQTKSGTDQSITITPRHKIKLTP